MLVAGRTRLVHDQPASVDELGREILAEDLAALVRELAADTEGPSAFALHLDAPWGAGKTTVARFLAAHLRQPTADPQTGTIPPVWTTIDLDAWRSSQLSPAWWALLAHVRRGVRDSMSFWRRRAFDVRLFVREAVRLWKVWLPAAAVVAALVVLWSLDTDVSAAMTALTTVVAFVIAVGGLGSRLFSLGSIQGARLHERLNDNPMEEVAEQIRWLRTQTRRPVLLVLDDLDRCNERFTVELLDAVQTLLRTPVTRTDRVRKPWRWSRKWRELKPWRWLPQRRDSSAPLPAFVVLAIGDRRWLRAAYEQTYAVFSPYVSEPGRPLGHLFLEKLFQVRFELPKLSRPVMSTYLSSLLRDRRDAVAESRVADEVAALLDHYEQEVRSVLAGSGSTAAHSVDDALLDVTSRASKALPGAEYYELAHKTLAARRQDPTRGTREKHLLEDFAGLIEPNPRAAKRFVMTYNFLVASRVAEGSDADGASLALWAVLATRWPALADWVHDQLPDGSLHPTPDSAHPSHLLKDEEVQRVVRSTLGGPLDRQRLLRCVGGTGNQDPLPSRIEHA
jgi:hypothetical protein